MKPMLQVIFFSTPLPLIRLPPEYEPYLSENKNKLERAQSVASCASTTYSDNSLRGADYRQTKAMFMQILSQSDNRKRKDLAERLSLNQSGLPHEIQAKYSLEGCDDEEKRTKADGLNRWIQQWNNVHHYEMRVRNVISAIREVGQWDTVVTFLERDHITTFAEKAALGDVTLNENSQNKNQCPTHIIPRFLSHNGSNEPMTSEMAVERSIGALFEGLMVGPHVSELEYVTIDNFHR
jgi:hypothetical protein